MTLRQEWYQPARRAVSVTPWRGALFQGSKRHPELASLIEGQMMHVYVLIVEERG